MNHNTKHGLLFFAFLIACGGGIAAFILLHKSHTQRQPSGKREIVGLKSYDISTGSLSTKATTTRHLNLERSELSQVYSTHVQRRTLSQHQNRHRSFTPETELGNPDSHFITIQTTTATSIGVPPLSTAAIGTTSSINIYSSFTMKTLSTMSAAGESQSSAALSSNQTPDVSLVFTTPTSPQPLATTGIRYSHPREFRG